MLSAGCIAVGFVLCAAGLILGIAGNRSSPATWTAVLALQVLGIVFLGVGEITE